MTAAELSQISRYSARKTILPGSELVGQDETVRFYANLRKGVVKLTKALADGRQQIVGLQFAPAIVGRTHSRKSGVTAQAATDVEICTIFKPSLERIAARSVNVSKRLHNQTLAELDQAREWMMTLGRKTAREKVADLLHLVAKHNSLQPEIGSSFDLPLTRQEIGDFLGLTIETVSRQITMLRKDNIITLTGSRNITVKKLALLADAAGIEDTLTASNRPPARRNS